MKAESLGCPFCKHCDAPESTEPCASCFDEGLDHPLNYKKSEYRGIVPKHITDMFIERMRENVLRLADEYNSCPRPRYCPYCGEVPEVVEETIYPGEKHCYVVCNGANLLPHSISVHGRSREEAVANWNSFALSLANKGK